MRTSRVRLVLKNEKADEFESVMMMVWCSLYIGGGVLVVQLECMFVFDIYCGRSYDTTRVFVIGERLDTTYILGVVH